MARLNISLPDDLYAEAERWRGSLNLSAICAEALRRELEAAGTHRSAPALLGAFQRPQPLERAVARRFRLAGAIVGRSARSEAEQREELGEAAAHYLERTLVDGALLAVGGGRQSWCVVRALHPRRLRITISALGIGTHDPRVLHAHPNTLTTLLWLLFAPHAEAHVVGSPAFASLWRLPAEEAPEPRHFVLASCGPYRSETPFFELLPSAEAADLAARGAEHDVAYCFFTKTGTPVEPPRFASCSLFPPEQLRALAARSDTRVLLVAGGHDKRTSMRLALEQRLCNFLVTDEETARALLEEPGAAHDQHA